jgi:hypothetical protein
MRFLPYEILTIESNLSPEEVHKRLAVVVEPAKQSRPLFSRKHKPYKGQIITNSRFLGLSTARVHLCPSSKVKSRQAIPDHPSSLSCTLTLLH